MEAALAIKVIIGLVGFGAWLFGKLKGAETPAPIAAPTTLPPRRSRRGRAAPPLPVVAEPAVPPPSPAPHLDASSLQVIRPVRAHARGRFRGAAALRQAVVAREVLGPPLALRPPRF